MIKEPIKVVAFDFDGVFVCDSDGVYKPEAWELVFGSYGERYRPFLAEGNRRFGPGQSGGRVAILRFVFEQLGEPAEKIPDLVERAAKVFDDDVQLKIKQAGLTPGARQALEELKRRGLILYLNSSTSTSALELTVNNLAIAPFFKGILGGTTKNKINNLRDIIQVENVSPTAVLVVGDGESDVAAAQAVGCGFVGVANKWNNWQDMPFPLITGLNGLLAFL